MDYLPKCDAITQSQLTTATNYIAEYNIKHHLHKLRGDERAARVALDSMMFWQNQLDSIAREAAKDLQTQIGY